MRSPRTAVSLGVGTVAVAGVSALGVYGFTAASPAHATRSSAAVQTVPQDKIVAAASTITRAQVLARAKTWHPHTSQRIPYSQARTHGGYRTDCSGYASMTLALPKPGPNTVGLANKSNSTRIAMSQLKPGDLVIDATGSNTTRHVVIFVKWTSGKHTAYWEYEQRGGYGTDYRTRTYGLAKGSQYHAYRAKKIR
jgi:cell wall-associated NlpC family hydrolase